MMTNARAWFDAQSFNGASRSEPTIRYTSVCTCGRCGGLDSGGLPRGAESVATNPSWNGVANINCPNGGTWRHVLVESLTAEQVAAEEREIFGRVR